MKEDSAEKSLETKSLLRFDLLIALFCGLLTLAHFLSFFFPKSRLWGINHLAYFPLWVNLIFTLLGLLILLPWFNSKVCKFLSQFFSLLTRLFAKREVIGYFFLGLISVFVFWLMRSKTHFLGDGYSYISQLQSENFVKIWPEPLEIFSHLYLYKFLKLLSSPSAEFIYAGLSILAGGVFVLILFFLTRIFSEDAFDRFLIFFLFLFSGATQLFLGYAEHYTLSYLSIFAYFYFSIRYLQGKAKIFLPLLLCFLSIGLHISSTHLLPSLFFLFTLERKNNKMLFSSKRVFPCLLILISLLGVFIYYIWRMKPILLEIFVPFSEGRPLALDYTLFSSSHLLDILNQHLLLWPTGVILLLALSLTHKGIIKFKDLILIFLIIACIAQLSFHFVVDPKLGAVRDWDLFSGAALGYALLGIYLFVSLVKSKRYSAVVLVFTTCLFTLPWFLLNANTEKAIDRFNNLLDLDSKRNLGGRYVLVYYYREKKRSAEAEETMANIFRIFPEDSLTRKASTYTNLGEYDRAMELLRKAIKINPSFHAAHNELGNIYLMRGEIDKALEEYQRAVYLNPFQRISRENLGNCLLRKGRLKEALVQFQKAEKLGEIRAESYCDMGNILFKLGKMKKAKMACKKALEMDPGLYEAHFELGRIYLETDSLNKALLEFGRVLRWRPDYAPAYYLRGVIYAQKGLEEKAIEELEMFLIHGSDEAKKVKVKDWILKLRSQNP